MLGIDGAGGGGGTASESTSHSDCALFVCYLRQVKLDFCDLGRVINGRPGDPKNQRPFEFAFTPEKIVASAAKLGLAPFDMARALSHRRVRDDTEDGERATAEQAIRLRHTNTMPLLTAVGIDCTALAAPPPAPASAVKSFVAGPSSAEEQFKALKAAGTCPGAIFHSVGAKAFNAPEVTRAALERLAEKRSVDDAKTVKATSEFITLQTRVRDILEWKGEESLEWSDLTQAERRDLISYVCRARGTTGVTKLCANAATAIEFLESLPDGEIERLLADPPSLQGEGRIAKGMAAATEPALLVGEAVAPLPQLLPPSSLLTSFGDPGVEYPQGLFPIRQPPWLEAACEPVHESGQKLVGMHILYKWPPRLGGWLLGKVAAVNTDEKIVMEGGMCNFRVYYPGDKQTAEHRLTVQKYAGTKKAGLDSWVVLGSGDE